MSVAQVPGFSNKKAIYSDGTAPGDSGWQEGTSLAPPFSLTVRGILGGGKVQVRVSNRYTKPAATALENQYGSDIVVDGVLAITAPFRWIRVIISVVSTGFVSADFFGFRPPGT